MTAKIMGYIMATAVGFLLCLIICQQNDAKPQTYKIPEEIRKKDSLTLDDPLPKHVPRVIPGTHDTEWVYLDSTTPLSRFPIEETKRKRKLPILIDGYVEYPEFWVAFGYQGVAKYLTIEPDVNTTVFLTSRKSEASRSPYSLFIYTGPMFNERAKFSSIEIGTMGYYKKFGVKGNINWNPLNDTVPLRFEFGPVLRFKLLGG